MNTYYSDRQKTGDRSCVLYMLLMLGVAALVTRCIFLRWPDRVVTIVISIVFGSLTIALLCLAGQVAVVLRFLPSMRYELQRDVLVLIIGPWKSRIPYDSIVDVVRKDLALSILSSFRMPGVALFDVPYPGEGTIRMYSTHPFADIIVIRTRDGKKYGISPADPSGFLQTLEQCKGQGAWTFVANSAPPASPKPVSWHNGWAVWLLLSCTLGMLIISMVMFPHLPDVLIVHWDVLGVPNGSLPRFWGVLLLPFISLMLAMVLLVLPDNPGVARRFLLILGISVVPLLLSCQLFLLLWNMGKSIVSARVFVLLLIILIPCSVVIQVTCILGIQKRERAS